jgi:hypothetical protein
MAYLLGNTLGSGNPNILKFRHIVMKLGNQILMLAGLISLSLLADVRSSLKIRQQSTVKQMVSPFLFT